LSYNVNWQAKIDQLSVLHAVNWKSPMEGNIQIRSKLTEYDFDNSPDNKSTTIQQYIQSKRTVSNLPID